MKNGIHTILFLLLFNARPALAQQAYLDSLHHKIEVTSNDTLRLILSGQLATAYSEISPDSAYKYAEKMLQIARKLKLRLEEAHALSEIAYAQINTGNYPRSLQTLLSAFALAEDAASEQRVLPSGFPPVNEFTNRFTSAYAQRLSALGRTHQYAGILYSNTNNFKKALSHYFTSRQLANEAGNRYLLTIIGLAAGRTYLALKQPDSALISEEDAYKEAIRIDYKKYIGSILLNMGRVFLFKGNKALAAGYFRQAIVASQEQNYFRGVVAGNLALADLLKQSNKKDSVLVLIERGLPVANYLNAPDLLLRSYAALADYYKSVFNNDSAVKYQSLVIKLNDSLFNTKQIQLFQNIDFDEEQKQQQIEIARAAYRSKTRMYVLITGLAIFLFIALLLWRNNKHKQRAYALLIQQKQETDFQKSKVEQALTELRATQAQLIQSEKMASLGEMAAGIAHEIQNPLNFVNNFSEVSIELIDDLKSEATKGRNGEVTALANEISGNLEKIASHGRRADSIVKSMLQHSRANAGQKQLIDMNALVDEYLRLSYQSLRSKDQLFQAVTKTDYDESIGKISIVPQDIGRVLLNLFQNAFYAVKKKKEQGNGTFEPVVSVCTRRQGGRVEISVKDNGNGISKNIVDKIFQPFFTTKPTGEGTGLGLSLSYDIITKGHGGTIEVKTKEGEGSIFTVQLPGV